MTDVSLINGLTVAALYGCANCLAQARDVYFLNAFSNISRLQVLFPKNPDFIKNISG